MIFGVSFFQEVRGWRFQYITGARYSCGGLSILCDFKLSKAYVARSIVVALGIYEYVTK